MDKITEIWSWIKKTFSPAYQSEIESYLSQSVDLADLESRMIYLQRRGLLWLDAFGKLLSPGAKRSTSTAGKHKTTYTIKE